MVHTSSLGGTVVRLERFTGIWVVPASLYASQDGALAAITFARTSPRPFLGTCGGFQHAVLEYTRNVRGMVTAAHGETQPDAELQVITPLRCSLVEREGAVMLSGGSRLRAIYGRDRAQEGYHCSYGLNPDIPGLTGDHGSGMDLLVSARDDQGEVRAVEIPGHPFFLATLFQPERRGLTGEIHPIITEFLRHSGASATP